MYKYIVMFNSVAVGHIGILVVMFVCTYENMILNVI